MGMPEMVADLLAEGALLGLDHVSSPERVAAVLGATEGETRSATELFRDHGLLEFAWEREAAGGPWRGVRMSVQLHRLALGDPGPVEPALTAAYGPPSGPVPFPEVAAAAARRGVALLDLPGASPGYREYWAPSGGVSLLVADGDEVYGLHVPMTAEWVAQRGTHDRRADRRTADHLAAAGPAEVDGWAARHWADAAPDRRRRVLAALRRRSEQRPDLWPGAVAAYLRLLGAARAHGVFDRAEAALLAARVDGDADAVVRELLAALPPFPGAGADLRRGRDLLAAARAWAPALRGGPLADRLARAARAWDVPLS